jgi:hypothetical protein
MDWSTWYVLLAMFIIVFNNKDVLMAFQDIPTYIYIYIYIYIWVNGNYKENNQL